MHDCAYADDLADRLRYIAELLPRSGSRSVDAYAIIGAPRDVIEKVGVWLDLVRSWLAADAPYAGHVSA